MKTENAVKIIFFFTFLVNQSIFADAFDDCVDKEISLLKKTEDFSSEGEVRCQGAGISGKGDSQNGNVSYAAAPNYQIVDNISITDTDNISITDISSNRGNYDAPIYGKDETGKIVTVTVPISCTSPNEPFGPGAWIKIRINGKVELPMTEQELNNIFENCAITTQ